jgi:hypothetical protein
MGNLADPIVFRHRGRDLTAADIASIQATTIAAHYARGRTFIGVRLCEQWDWRQGNGQYKAFAARGTGRVAGAAADQGEPAAAELQADAALCPDAAGRHTGRASGCSAAAGAGRGRALFNRLLSHGLFATW